MWSADPGVDLFSRGAELVRATMEAGGYAAYVGADHSYPGYARGVAALTDEIERSKTPDLGVKKLVSPQPTDPDLKLQPLTTYLHMTAFDATDTKVSAIVCGYTVWPEQLPYEDDRYVGGGTRIELENTVADPGAAGIANRDPNYQDPRAHRSPRWDVFGTWRVTTIKGPVGAGQYAPECLPWYQQQFPTFTKVPDLSELQAPPGYQAPHHPVAPQFPEWIGPTKTG
ncbi:hypothetical protein [Nocardia terpenica]|uniref:Uncharacterized protein n=1 Tax=Nocardia terpenica TaxID=455432 RepID=A0A164L1M4_9NOCA|nr:hypothetical protein [Nocardia terpenica]KZM71926.1 hypothetical protein AWN90_37365 [Nocardia terpenica]NQE86504.1 hypothetical protein [Nocardia terpenica]